jgi:ComF family protein
MCPFFKQPCLLCGSFSAIDGFCPPCRQSLVRLAEPHCPRCALPLQEQGLCGHCQRSPPAFDALHVPYVFCYPLSELIHRFKYGKRLELSGALGRLLQQNSPKVTLDFDLLIPVPLSKERLAERGFNQSVELARAVAGIMPDRFQPTVCWRKRNTCSQALLTPAGRRRNLLDAFCVETSLDGLSVAIVDDVVTTGSTLNAMAKTLKKRGAIRVEAWALARTLVFNT